MRPIDADKLKITDTWALVEKETEDGNAEENNTFTFAPLKCVLLRDIENAPPIELTETEIQKVLNKRCMTAVTNEYLIGLHGKRPHGEWLIVKDKKRGDSVKCPFCGKELAGTDLNFCCKCGAKMKGGAT